MPGFARRFDSSDACVVNHVQASEVIGRHGDVVFKVGVRQDQAGREDRGEAEGREEPPSEERHFATFSDTQNLSPKLQP